jgi:hypothetical protein
VTEFRVYQYASDYIFSGHPLYTCYHLHITLRYGREIGFMGGSFRYPSIFFLILDGNNKIIKKNKDGNKKKYW